MISAQSAALMQDAEHVRKPLPHRKIAVMNAELADRLTPRTLEAIFKDQLDTTMECGEALSQLFLHLEEPEAHIARVKQLEERGDRLTAEAYHTLELLDYSEFIHITEQFVKRLDDTIDGLNDTARLIDICQPHKIEDEAHSILSVLIKMISSLQGEMTQYPDNALERVRELRENLKRSEEVADLIYHDWRKKQHRILVLPLVDEYNWTEILGVLEQTTDSAYHAAVLLERFVRFRQRQ